METRHLDPFLYRSNTELNKLNRYNTSKIKKQDSNINSFQETLQKKIHGMKGDSTLKESHSSSVLNQIPDKETILKHVGNHKDRLKLYEAAKEFESFFVEKMFREMQKNLPKTGLFHGGYAEEIFEEMLLTERVRNVSKHTHYGLAEMIYKQLQSI